jgi:hypothetical protein
MINNDKSGLLIFDNFHIDFNLPKWRLRRNNTDMSTPMDSDTFNRFTRSRTGGVVSGFTINPTGNWVVTSSDLPDASGRSGTEKKEGLFDKLFGRAKKRRKLEEQRIKDEMLHANFEIATVDTNAEFHVAPAEISPKEFFESVKNSAEELVLANERFASYEKAIAHLKRTGQIAILERMEYDLEIHRAETQLYAIGHTKVVTEKNVADFASKACRELRLDWIKNFSRLIPEKVLEAKEKCDENLIFDNYVIMHYDPYKDGVLQTVDEIKAQIAKEKDPILFGVIAGSNKLYYIADWIDEYCDLTFDKLVEKLGDEAISANDLTAEVKISRF